MPLRRFTLLVALALQGLFFIPKVPDTGTKVELIPHIDKLAHLVVFAFTTWAVARVAAGSGRRMWSQLMLACVGLVVWAWVIELIQQAMPLRSADPADVAADCVGIALGAAFAAIEVSRQTRTARTRRQSAP